MTNLIPENSENIYDTIIIGGGISGLTAGIYTGRAGQKTLIIEGGYNSNTDMPGGQLLLTPDIENFPGYTGGSGTGLIDTTREQAENAGCEIITENAVEFDFNGADGLHSVTTDEEETTYSAKSIILATGAVARRLGIPGEDDYYGKGVSSCATCDGAFFAGKDVAVVGGGDTAVEDALYLADIASKVYLIHRRDELRTDSPESRKLLGLDNVEVVWNTRPENVVGEKFVTNVNLTSTVTGQNSSLNVEALFVAIGHDPATKHFDGTGVELADGGYLRERDTFTNIPGVFAAGDVADSIYRQAVTAAASGAKAAMNSIKYNKVGAH
jgi:thioredoxin reductase (NADPH)